MSAPPPPEVVITEVLPEVLTYDTYLTFEGTEVSTFVVSTYLRTYFRTYVRSLRIILKYLSILQYTTHGGAVKSEATTLIWGETREIGEAKKFSKSSVKFSNFPKNRR